MSFQVNNYDSSLSSQEEIKPLKHPNRLSKSVDSWKENPDSNGNVVQELSTTVPFTTRVERSKSISDKFSPRSFEKKSPPKQLKSSSKKTLNKRVFKSLMDDDVSFPIVTKEDTRSELHKRCIAAFEKIEFGKQENLCEDILLQAQTVKNVVAGESDLWTNYEFKIRNALLLLESSTVQETTKKLEQLKKSLKSILELKIASIGDFAASYLSTLNQVPKYKKDLNPIFYKIIAGDEKRTVSLLKFLGKWSRNPKSLGELSVSFYNSYMSKKTFPIASAPIQILDEMIIPLADVKRHLVVEGVLQIKKIVVNQTLINLLDLLQDKEDAKLKDAILYKKVFSAVSKQDPTDREIAEFMQAEQFTDLKSPEIIKVAHLMRSGTINFWKLSHDTFLGMLKLVNSVKAVQESGSTSWNIQVDSDECMSLNQMKIYRIQEMSQENEILMTVHLQCLTMFDFKTNQIKSHLTISRMTPKEKMTDDQRALLLKVLGFQS